jgi:hypothetical protein
MDNLMGFQVCIFKSKSFLFETSDDRCKKHQIYLVETSVCGLRRWPKCELVPQLIFFLPKPGLLEFIRNFHQQKSLNKSISPTF